MNKGVKHSSGEWIFFLNSGDIFYSKKTLINISNKLNNSFDFIYGNVAIQRNGFKNILPSSDFNLSSLIIPFSHQGIFSKKKLFRKKKFNLNFKIASDFEFFYFYLKKNKKFLKVNYTISTLETLGLSDTKRLSAFNEYEKIAIRYSNSTFIRVKFFLFKVRVLLIHFLKLLLPNDFLKLLIYLKYSKLT